MLQFPASRCFAALVAVFTISSHGHAQDTYNLRGEGAKPGMEYTTNAISIIKGTINGELGKIMLTVKQNITVKSVDMSGNILEADVIVTGEGSNSADPSDNKVFDKVSGRKIICKRNGRDWVTTLEDGSQPEDMQKELADFPCPSLQREFMPILGVPVGYKWEVNANDYWDVVAIVNKELAGWGKDLSGKISYTFEKLGIIDGIPCAYLKCVFAFRGNIKPKEEGAISLKADFKGKSSEIRRISDGILIKQEGISETKMSGNGYKMNMTQETSLTNRFN